MCYNQTSDLIWFFHKKMDQNLINEPLRIDNDLISYEIKLRIFIVLARDQHYEMRR